MKTLIRSFFKILHIVLGPFMLLWETISRPKGIVRSREAQEGVDLQCRRMVLYQYRTCPFCIKVRREIRRLSLPIETLDAQPHGMIRDELLRGGGQTKVPCLKLTDQAGNSQWLYDSGAIIEYLRGRFLST